MVSNKTNIGICVSCVMVGTIFILTSLFSIKSLTFNIFLNFGPSEWSRFMPSSQMKVNFVAQMVLRLVVLLNALHQIRAHHLQKETV